jgi:hypothetical protein
MESDSTIAINEAPKKSRFAEIADSIIKPIIDEVSKTAFQCVYTDSHIIPIAIKEGVLEKLDEVIEHLEDQQSFYASASIIGDALGKDGNAPARKYKGMVEVATALRDLIKARKEQMETEIAAAREHNERTAMAERLGFGGI